MSSKALLFNLCSFNNLYNCSVCCTKLTINIGCRSISSSTISRVAEQNKYNNVFNPEYINRNPRNLEQLGIEKKRKGWPFQYPPKEWYHRVYLDRAHRFVTGRVEHASGKTVVIASTKEWAIKKHLYSTTDVSAAESIGQVLADRCLQAGITNAYFYKDEEFQSEKVQVFYKAMEESGFTFKEEEEYVKPYEPGIDYDKVDERSIGTVPDQIDWDNDPDHVSMNDRVKFH